MTDRALVVALLFVFLLPAVVHAVAVIKEPPQSHQQNCTRCIKGYGCEPCE